MSQTNSSLLDEVVLWSQETCRQELKAVLPKLTSLHHESESWEDNIRILKIITDMFMPHIGLSELEDEYFSKVLPKAAAVFDNMVKEILDQVGGLSSQNTELCAFLRKILEKGLLEVLDRVSVDSSSSDEEVSDIVTVIHSLLDICSVISNLDIALHANTWKFLIKHSLKYHSLVEEHLRHEDICTALCENLLTSFKNCLEMAEQMQISGLQETAQTPELKLFQKSAKMCRFFGNTLVHYIKEFSVFMTKYCRCFYQLYLEITSKFPPSLSAPLLPPGLSEELNVAAQIPLDALLFQLLPLRAFAEVVLQPNPKVVTEQELAQCLLLVSVIDQLASQPEDVQQLWCTGSQFSEEIQRLPLYDAVFTSFRRCSTERRVPVLLPGVMMNGQAQTLVTLHQHVCVHVCANVAALPPHFFTVLEQCLVRAVLQADTPTALLAMDIWCFTARYGTAELCLHHALLVAQMVKTSTTGSYQSSHLGLLLRRMAFLITPNHQMTFVDEFPPSVMENLTLWSHILLKAFSEEARCTIESGILGMAQKMLSDWQNDDCKLGQVNTMNQVLLGLLVVTRGQTSAETHCAETVGKMITQIWFRMSPDQIKSYPMLQCTLELLLQISTVLVKNIEPQVIYQALLCVEAVASLKSVDELLLVALEFLSSLGKIFVPPDCQSQILPRLSGLFRMLLISPSWVLQQHALEAFSQFAESTNHEEVISQSLCEEETKTVVVNYLSKTVKELEERAARLERLKMETQVIDRFNEKLETDEGPVNLPEEPDAEAEPRPKRLRQECSQEQDYRCHIETAENSLKALQRLLEDKSDTHETPLWVESRLEDLHKLLSIITQAKHTT